MIRTVNRGPWPATFRAGMLLLAAIGFPGTAYGYRPFDGTDATVAEPGEFELEF